MAETNNAVFEEIATRFVEKYAMLSNAFKDTEMNKVRAIKSLTDTYKLKDILIVVNMPKSTYEYRAKKLEDSGSLSQIENEIKKIKSKHSDFGYRRVHNILVENGFNVNKKRVQHIMQKLDLQVKTKHKENIGPKNGGHTLAYLGSKKALLGFITAPLDNIKKEIKKSKLITLDIFAGSGIVAKELKKHSSILYTNDIEDYSKVINECILTNKSDFDEEQYNYYLNLLNENIKDNPTKGIITKLYAPKNTDNIQPNERCYFTHENAVFIDSARKYIDEIIPEDYRKFFLAQLLIEASYYANTSGHFKSFYKSKETGVGKFGGDTESALCRIKGNMRLSTPTFSPFECNVKVYQKDAIELAKELKGIDVTYIDPPYNEVSYGSSYHILNTIVNNEINAEISRISGIPANWKRSLFSSKDNAAKALNELISSLDSKYIIMSYNDEGIISLGKIYLTLSKYGYVDIKVTDHNSFNGSRNKNFRKVKEYLFILKKH